jgi:hypothetical protein
VDRARKTMDKIDKELGRWLWFFGGMCAIFIAGITKIVIADKLNKS